MQYFYFFFTFFQNDVADESARHEKLENSNTLWEPEDNAKGIWIKRQDLKRSKIIVCIIASKIKTVREIRDRALS